MLNRIVRIAAAGFLLTGGAAGAAAATPAHFTLADLAKIVRLSDPQISPDGAKIAILVSTPDLKTDKPKTELDLVDSASGARRVLSKEREDISNLRWSPDGTALAFLAKAPKSAKEDDSGEQGDDSSDEEGGGEAQIYLMRMDGGDAQKLTSAKHGVESFAFSPDGAAIAFIAPDDPVNEKAIKAHNDSFEVTDNNFLVRAAAAPSHLWIIPAAGGKATRLTEGAFSLQTDQRDAAPDPSFAPDGKTIAFTRFPGPWWGPSFHSVIDSVAASGGAPQTLIGDEGADDFTYAPAGDAAAFMRPRAGDQNNGNAVYVREGGKVFDATAALAHNIGDYRWLPDGVSLLLSGWAGAHSVFWRQPLHGAAQEIDLGGLEVGRGFSIAKTGAIAFLADAAEAAPELYVLDHIGARPRKLTDVNAFLSKLALGAARAIDWRNDGFDEDGVLVTPPGFKTGKKYPLVLVIHGGPEGASTVAFSPLPQLLAAAGFLVFSPNYRGSINLGDDYQHAIYRDTGEGPGKDAMAGLAAVEKLGIVDENRIGVSGWSYGGYMTTWLTGHYPAFKAAVAGAALTDWVMDYTVAFYQTGDLYFFGGGPWTEKDFAIWREQSPIAYAAHVTAPTLIMGDVGDPNVPLVNSYEWYHALRDNGVKVKFIAYPADTHFPGDIVRTSDVYRRWVDWMKEHLK